MGILDYIPQGICGIDESKRIRFWNREMELISGIRNENIIKKPADVLNFYESRTSDEAIDIFQCISNGEKLEKRISRSLYLELQNKRVFVFVQIVKKQIPDYPEIMLFITDLSNEYFCTYIEKAEQGADSFYGIVGKHRKMLELYDLIKIASETLANVLITGESGTGKELVAKAIHDNSDRKNMPFVVVNCSALTENLLESELFGHVKGSFTGAYKDKPGKFETAHGGTLFLDEIGDISPAVQLKLLRVIQERTFERVGGNEPVNVDIRIITATNKNLRKFIRKEKFREDLFYRLKVFPITTIPLRERKMDIPLLCEHFIGVFNKNTGKEISGLTADSKKLLMDYCWPGNVRELENCIEYSFAVCRGNKIDSFDLPDEIKSVSLRDEVCEEPGDKTSKRLNISANELKSILITNNWNKTVTARQLGISRVALWKKIKNFGIEE